MKRLVSILVLLLVAGVPVAVAQMNGGGNHQGQNGAMNGMTGVMNGMDGRAFLVGSDGTAYALRVTTPATTGVPAALEVVAVRPSGVIGWTAAVASGIPSIDLSGSDLMVTIRAIGTPSAASSTLTALSTASGAVRWTVKLDGIALAVEPFSGGTYVTVVKPSQGSSGGMQGNHGQATGSGTRMLVAVGTDGKILWTLALSR